MNKIDPEEESKKNTLTSTFTTTVPIPAYSSIGRNRMISDSQRFYERALIQVSLAKIARHTMHC